SRIKPFGQGAVLLESEKPPSQLDHAAPDPGIAGARKALLAPAPAAFVRRAGEAGITGNGPVIAQVARDDLVNQHVRCLDADAQDPRKQRTIACGPFSVRGAALSIRRRSCSISRIWSRTTRSRARWRRNSARVFSGSGIASAVRKLSSFSAALRRVGL